jgi:YVTN family beta-propeller protein
MFGPRSTAGLDSVRPVKRIASAFAVAGLALVPQAADARSIYVTEQGADSVAVIDSNTNTATGFPIGVGHFPLGIAMTPSGTHAYVVNNATDGGVSVIDTTTNSAGPTIALNPGDTAFSIAVNPAGTRAYVTNQSNPTGTLQPVDLVNNIKVGTPMTVSDPRVPSFSPDGGRAFIPGVGDNTVAVVNAATFTTVGSPIPVVPSPFATAITPDGRRLYVTNTGGSVSVIDTATNALIGSPIMVGQIPRGIAITPDGSRAYVTNRGSNTVSVIDLASNAVVGEPIAVGVSPDGIAISPDGASAYVANSGGAASSVSVIDTRSNSVVTTIPLANGSLPERIVITPNQAPTASFSVGPAGAAVPTTFNASGSSDSDGSVAHYSWDFGDGTALADGGPTPAHVYAVPGDYTVKLTVTDNEGCSTQFVFTGQTASCNGKPAAATQSQITVAPDSTAPTVKIGKLKKEYETSKVKITFTSSEPGSTFACKLDKKKAKGCSSPVTYKHLKPGKHIFRLSAVDAAGNQSQASKAKFKVADAG